MKKQTLSVTRLLQRMWEVADTLDEIKKELLSRRGPALRVTFYHREDFSFIKYIWNDKYYGCSDNKDKHYEYVYELNSEGIHFVAFDERKKGGLWYESSRNWSSSGHENAMRLIDVPNNCPPNQKLSMYAFHQEKIREHFAAIPAWAIVVMH